MFYVDRTYEDPRENLECDLRLLDQCDQGRFGGALRFWEAPAPVVVAGHSNRSLVEIRLGRCTELGVPVLRRSSGGGTVVLGPGCLAYAVILEVEPGGPLDGIRRTNTFVMEKNRRALEATCRRPVVVAGYTDLVVSHDGGPRKFSGNSQRRKRNAALFHGTFLFDFDLSLVEELLDNPQVAPGYRGGRPHAEFLANLGVSPETIRESMRREWEAFSPIPRDMG
jgi:lipoate-protein ligase A